MEPLLELVSAWQEYSQRTNLASVEDFCTYYLSTKKNSVQIDKRIDLNLAKQLGKTNSLLKLYFRRALMQISDVELEWYYFLDAIALAGEIRKNDIVSFHLLSEPTTGIDILNRMLKAGLISERVDPDDKRARLITLTSKGKDYLSKLNSLFNEISKHIFSLIDIDTKSAMVSAFTKLVAEYSNAIRDDKSKAIETMENTLTRFTRKVKI
ncbi:MAG TPA: MarR family winged helix-turn-helix transcriptional regulator [Cyclobacteriaceae bacterium]|nr:MarR family winged helix-turn-helix transcriptional regulator [Cyclobacteriaceae bacterium]